MKPGLAVGATSQVCFKVTSEMCPAFDGHVVHRVCSTWSIVHYMELAGRRVLLPHLEEDEEGVGSHVTCDHLGPAPVGAEVRVTATATKVSERELVCECVAYRGDKRIATGTTVQRIFPKAVLERILNRGGGSD